MDSSGRQPRRWTLAEDAKLREEVEAQLIGGDVKDWCRIAEKLPGRTNKDCRKRWHNSVAGGLKKGQWSKSEDDLLSRGIEQHGQRWTLVAGCVGSRSADQCAKRWQQSLDPDLDRSEWRDAEDEILIEATQRLGRHWKDIQQEHFPGRSKNDIKNRYTVLIRRYENQGITLPSVASSPSESSIPAPISGHLDDDGYTSFTSRTYDHLLPTQSQATSSGGHRSWSSSNRDEYSTWSSPQDYSMPITRTGPVVHHTTTPMSNYAFTQPPTLSSNAPADSTSWGRTTISMNPSASPSATSSSMSNPSYYGYDNYPVVQQPIINYSSSYSPSPVRATYDTTPNPSPMSMPSPRTTEQQNHDSNTSVPYPGPGHPHDPMYRF